ncbi:transferase family hexapeptide repeat protein [Flavobacterium sp. 1]|uniref:acyltransferase n=1 Tax=Flavobacterium sp. 1 TaxID=2035200 RepID=UPI000C24269D|nr:acyltransferase [Flavobacterium sp. 1]PJJ11112.1 transferase family hexapeptide repeat protein [Flavobacterium sp. 1]
MIVKLHRKGSKFLNIVINSLNWRWGRFKMKSYGISFGKNLIVQGNLYLKTGINFNAVIGDNCCFKSGRGLNPLSRNIKTSIQIEDGASLIIGNHCGFSSVCLWSHQSIFIGNYVNIGADTIVLDSDAHSLSFLDRRNDELDFKNKVNKPIVIGDDVLIGTRCIILKGVKIGARSIIGSGSIVLHDIPEDCIAAGNPAKVIRRIN